MEFESRFRKKHLPRLRSMNQAQRLEDVPAHTGVVVYLRGAGQDRVFKARVLEKVPSGQVTNPMIRVHRGDIPRHEMFLGGGTAVVSENK